MRITQQIRGFLRGLRSNGDITEARHSGHSLAKTLRDSTHVRGGRGGLGRAGTEQQHKIVAEGHQNYTDSFDD